MTCPCSPVVKVLGRRVKLRPYGGIEMCVLLLLERDALSGRVQTSARSRPPTKKNYFQ